MATAAPKPASTVILVRPDSRGGFELLMTRRPDDMPVLGGFYVFPGGALEEADYSDGILSRCHGLSPREAQKILGNHPSPQLSMGHWVAGVRELFEEVGILLCIGEDGSRLDMNSDGRLEKYAERRAALVRGAVGFPNFLEAERLRLDLGRLVYFSHRITPEHRPFRFDTRFYLAPLPPDQTPLASSEEVAESFWIAPQEALAQAEKGKLRLMPPTVVALKTLAGFASWQGLIARYPLG